MGGWGRPNYQLLITHYLLLITHQILMTTQLELSEIQDYQQLLPNNTQIQQALTIIEDNDGDLEAAFDRLWQEKFGQVNYGAKKSLLKLTLEEIRAEICGDEGLRGKIKEHTKDPKSASLLNSIIGSLVTVAALNGIPIDGAIATVVALYILKIGVNVYCKYTEPESESNN